MLIGILQHFVGGWTWYELLFLFGGVFLLILGILIFVFRSARKKVVLEPKPVKTDAETPSVVLTKEKQELLDYYERQRENWKSNLSLRIINVKPALDTTVPKVTFEFEMINFLPIEVKLAKVVDSWGTVNAFGFGLRDLPAFKGETIDKTARKCDILSFSLTMEVGKTGLPEFLKPKLTEGHQGFQWILRAKWYIEIEKKEEEWNLGDLLYNQVIAKQ